MTRIFGILIAVIFLSVGQTASAQDGELLKRAQADTCPVPFRASNLETFGVPVCGMSNVRDRALGHAAAVMQRQLDYDQDGTPDNPAVVNELLDSGAFFAVFRRESDIDRFFDSIPNDAHETYETSTVVMEDEMDISGREGWDPTVEEALHLVTQFGYAEVYPTVFGERKGSEIAVLMDQARGGYFQRVPRQYPTGAYYTYDDRSCDYSCQVTEFTFWAITSMRGYHQKRRGDIDEEWRLNTPSRMQQNARELVAMLSRPEFGIAF